MHPFMTCAYVSTGLKLNHHLAASTPPFLTHRLMNKTHEACREAAIATKILQRWTCRQLLGYFPWRCVRLPKIGWYFGKWKLVTSSHFLAFLMYIYIYVPHMFFDFLLENAGELTGRRYFQLFFEAYMEKLFTGEWRVWTWFFFLKRFR